MDLLAVQGTQDSSPKPQFKSINSSALSVLYRLFRSGLNQIPHKYTVEVTNKFKRPDLRVTEEIWIEVWDIVQEAVIKTIPMKKKCKKAKWLQKGKKKKKRGGGHF